MSNFLAIAAVTETLRQFVLEAVQTVPKLSASPVVKAGRPENAGTQFVGVNVYLFRVEPNAALANSDQPNRLPDGSLVKRPRLALNLFYLLTFFGDEVTLEPQRLLGSVMIAMHAQSVLTPAVIGRALNRATQDFLRASDLAEQTERIKITPLNLTLEELSKMWTVFFQVTHALSVAYQASVVLLEPGLTAKEALPVVERRISAIPFLPAIKNIQPAELVFSPAAEVEIDLAETPPAGTQVFFDGIPGTITSAAQGTLTVQLPDGVSPGTVQVSLAPPARQTGFAPAAGSSGASAVFVLRPVISSAVAAPSVPDPLNPASPASVLAIAFTPDIRAGQALELLGNALPGPAQAASPPASFALSSLVRFEIDAAVAADLDTGQVTAAIGDAFTLNKVELSKPAVTILAAGAKWRIDDPKKGSYLIRTGLNLLTVDCLPPGAWTNAVSFRRVNVPAGTYCVRLRVDGLSRAQSLLSEGALLFSGSTASVSGLDAGTVPTRLRNEFQKAGNVLPPGATAIVRNAGSEWTIPVTPGRSFLVKLDGKALRVYDTGAPTAAVIGPLVVMP